MFDFHGFEMTVFKLLIGVILIVLHLRLTGKQQTTQMTPITLLGTSFWVASSVASFIISPFLSRNTSVFSW